MSRANPGDYFLAPGLSSPADASTPTKLPSTAEHGNLVVPVCNPQVNFDGFTIQSESVELSGYELYAVESWVLDRSRSSKVIVVFTGDVNDKILVDVWSPPLHGKRAMESWALATQHLCTEGARAKKTPLGLLHVTSLTNFPIHSIVQLPSPASLSGKTQRDLYVNINLGRSNCAIRTSLTLAEPPSDQQEKFIKLYHLSPVSTTEQFAVNVIGLVGLVQKALALFGMGPLAQDLAIWQREQRNMSFKGKAVAGLYDNAQADGLLCELTIRGLANWAIEIGEPTMQFRTIEWELSPTIVAALLSSVIAIRRKLVALGYHSIPRDPFENRRKFVMALRTVKTSSSGFVFLDSARIAQLRHQFSAHQATDTSRVRRLVKSKFEDVLSQQTPIAIEEETSDIKVFSDMIKYGEGPVNMEELQVLWNGKERVKTAPTAAFDRHKRNTSGLLHASTQMTQTSSSHTHDDTTDTDADTRLRGLGLLKDLGGKAGRAGRKIGVNVGLLEKTNRIDSQTTYTESPSTYLAPPRPNLVNRLSIDTTETPLATVHPETVIRLKYRPTEAQLQILSRYTAASHKEIWNRLLLTRPRAFKRNASYSGEFWAEDEAFSFKHPSRETLQRRHSFTSLDFIAGANILQHPRVLKNDVDMCANYRQLVARRQKLRKLVATLEDVHQAYTDAYTSLQGPMNDRQRETEELKAKAESMLAESHNLASLTDAGSSLIEDQNRLDYSQGVMNGNIGVLENFVKKLESKIGAQGSLRRAIDVLTTQRGLLQRLVAFFEKKFSSKPPLSTTASPSLTPQLTATPDHVHPQP